MTLSPLHSLRFQIVALLALLLLLMAGGVGYTLYVLQHSQDDQLLLNLVSRLQLQNQKLVRESRAYLRYAPEDLSTYFRDVKFYYADLKEYAALFDAAVQAFAAGRFEPELTGASRPVQPHLGPETMAAAEHLQETWQSFRSALDEALGDDPQLPRLLAAAGFIVDNEETLSQAVDALAGLLRDRIDRHMLELQQFGVAGLGLAGIVTLFALLWFWFRVLAPLGHAVRGFERVAQGDFGYQVPVETGSEIGQMSAAFNSLSRRLNALFRLIHRIQGARDLDSTLRFVWEEFHELLPLDWVGLLFVTPDETALELERAYAHGRSSTAERLQFPLDTGLRRALESDEPVHVASLREVLASDPDNEAARRLAAQGMESVILMPFQGQGGVRGMLVFASTRPEAYRREHLELISNLAQLMASGLQKTVIMENLVVTAVQGLARLAESRDPETGDHLERMSRYSAIIADELGRDPGFAGIIRPRYVRDVYRFAPMHDIGKVGISDRILLKPGKLTDEEEAEMHRHPLIGGEVLRQCEAQMAPLGFSIFRVGIEIAECHHERWDGSGYPRGLAGEEIPLSARIIAVADVFDALTSKRPYKAAWSLEDGLRWIRERAGQAFDPAVVQAMERALPRIEQVYEKLKHV